ncbi:MAG: hypothetical protein BA864_13225 [Desulfuromonadales bacterium C00003093]|nr:MAG: hypothetical protein BA864_13225 [Desulfuromonadales bacterium C00003093]
MDTTSFLIWKRAIFCKVKEIKGLRGDVHQYVAQASLQIDAEIAKKGRFQAETSYYKVTITAQHEGQGKADGSGTGKKLLKYRDGMGSSDQNSNS